MSIRRCKNCNNQFPSSFKIDGKRISLTGRSYCLDCSPYNSDKGYELRKRTNFLSDEDFAKLVSNSYSIRKVLQSCGLKPAGGNYQTIKKRIKKLNLNIDHFTGQGHLKNKTHNWSPKRPLKDILKENSYFTSHHLKNRLIKEGFFEHKCYQCGLTEWNNDKIPLELEHKNGIHDDNRIENLTLLCPNCHAQTKTYRGKNIGKL